MGEWIIRILIGGGMIYIGYLFLRYANWLVFNIGRISWAEKYLGSSHRFYRILGLVVIFFGFLTMTNLLGPFIMATIGRLFGAH